MNDNDQQAVHAACQKLRKVFGDECTVSISLETTWNLRASDEAPRQRSVWDAAVFRDAEVVAGGRGETPEAAADKAIASAKRKLETVREDLERFDFIDQ